MSGINSVFGTVEAAQCDHFGQKESENLNQMITITRFV